MTQSKPMPDPDNARAEKARMLITILGNDFTRKSQHPFFRSLTEAAAEPAVPRTDQPDISRALKNLMSHLSSQDAGGGLTAEAPSKATIFSPENYVSAGQHPALIASTLSKLDGTKRRAVLRKLSGPLACRVLVYMREIEDKSA
jgi:hypothetical protein